MSELLGRSLSVDKDDVKAFVFNHLAEHVNGVWLIGSRSMRKGKVPRPDSDWDLCLNLKVQANDLDLIPNPRSIGIHACLFRCTIPPSGAVELYPHWNYK